MCKKNNELEKKVNDLNERVNQLENDLKMIKDAFVLDSSDENVIKDFFEKKPKASKLIYNGKDRNNFFVNCEGKKNLLFLVKDTKGNKFGGYMSSTLIKNDDLNIKDENSFIFSVQNKKKFKVLNPSKAIYVRSEYLITFGVMEVEMIFIFRKTAEEQIKKKLMVIKIMKQQMVILHLL